MLRPLDGLLMDCKVYGRRSRMVIGLIPGEAGVKQEEKIVVVEA